MKLKTPAVCELTPAFGMRGTNKGVVLLDCSEDMVGPYGWRFSSDMPDVYISRASMVSEQLDEKFTQTELSSFKNEVTELREQERIKQDQIQGLQNKVHNMVRHLEQVAELLKLTSDPTLIETALARVRQSHRKA